MTRHRNVSFVLEDARSRLKGVSDTPSLEAQVLLGAAMSRPRSWLLAHPDEGIDAASDALFETWLDRRSAGFPLPYLLGEWEFYGRSFIVSPDVLIPRPETELLVEQGVRWLKNRPPGARVVDAGTGSGCIAISLALAAPKACITGLDISPAALRTARRNAERYATSNTVWVESDLLYGLAADWHPVDLICANLPYIPSKQLRKLDVAVHEPLLALDGGAKGTEQISRLLLQAVRVLAPDGMMLLEIEAGQGESVPAMARDLYPGAQVECLNDLAGLPRIVRIDRSGFIKR